MTETAYKGKREYRKDLWKDFSSCFEIVGSGLGNVFSQKPKSRYDSSFENLSNNKQETPGNCGFGHIYWRNANGKLHFSYNEKTDPSFFFCLLFEREAVAPCNGSRTRRSDKKIEDNRSSKCLFILYFTGWNRFRNNYLLKQN